MSPHFSWQSAVLQSGCESTTKYVLLVVGTYMNQHGDGAFPSHSTIAETASLHRATVIKHLGLAEEAGWLRVTRRTNKDGEPDSNLYGISFPDVEIITGEDREVVVQNDYLVAQNDGGSRPKRLGSRPERRGVVVQNDTTTSLLTPQVTPQVTQTGLTASALQADGLDADLASELLAHRKRKKATLTRRAWDAIKREANKAGWPLQAAVEKLIERDWKGFEADWVAPKRGGGNDKQSEWDAVMAQFVGKRGNPDDPYTIDMEV